MDLLDIKNRIVCFFKKHHFVRYTTLNGQIQVMCTNCDKTFTMTQNVDSEDSIEE